MRKAQSKDRTTLSQQEKEYILNQPIPEPKIIEQIQAAAQSGVCQATSYLSVYHLGLLHGMRIMKQER